MTDLPIPHSVGRDVLHSGLFLLVCPLFWSIYALLLVDVTTLVYIMSSAVKI